MRTLALLASWLAVPVLAFAADGDAYKVSVNTGSPATKVTGYKLCDGKASGGAGAITCGPIYAPECASATTVTIRPASGTSAAGCGYDDLIVYSMSTSATAAGNELPQLTRLDDDGSSSGVQQFILTGSAGPWFYASGTATAGTCDADNTVNVHILCSNPQLP